MTMVMFTHRVKLHPQAVHDVCVSARSAIARLGFLGATARSNRFEG